VGIPEGTGRWQWVLAGLCLVSIGWAMQDLASMVAWLNLHLYEDYWYPYTPLLRLRSWIHGQFGIWIGNGTVFAVQHALVALLLGVLGGAGLSRSSAWHASSRLRLGLVVAGLLSPWVVLLYLSDPPGAMPPLPGATRAAAYGLLIAYGAAVVAATTRAARAVRRPLFLIVALSVFYCILALTYWWLPQTGAIWTSFALLLWVIAQDELGELV
jgi:hypothetical protein